MIENLLQEQCNRQIEENIFSNLVLPQKKISSMYFYDQTGSTLFEEITKLPEYYLTRTEIPLIKKAAHYLKESLTDMNIIEFGSGDCRKISIVLDVISDEIRKTVCYIPFDVSTSAIQRSCDMLTQKYSGLRIHGIVADFMTQLDVIANVPHKLLCFLGSTIGNFDTDHSVQFLKKLQAIMQAKDRLLLGFDMVKNKEIIENAYNDNQKITEQFNKNILNVINKLVETDFNPDSYEHVAFYNEKLNRIEMHLKALKHQEVRSPNFTHTIHIEKGETIHTENSYKFTIDKIEELAKKSDLQIEKLFTDEHKWFSLAIFTKSDEES